MVATLSADELYRICSVVLSALGIRIKPHSFSNKIYKLGVEGLVAELDNHVNAFTRSGVSIANQTKGKKKGITYRSKQRLLSTMRASGWTRQYMALAPSPSAG